MYSVVSLFAGIGGICLGFQQAGFDVIWANEKDHAACLTYRHNFGNDYLVFERFQKKAYRTLMCLLLDFRVNPFLPLEPGEVLLTQEALCFLRLSEWLKQSSRE